MEFAEDEKIRAATDESESPSSPSSSVKFCRICHEEEEKEDDSSSMESPCSCSGTLKFAHRRCIQRWCDEKGSIVCEICLQIFEPDYVVATHPPPAKSRSVDVIVTIRGNYEDESHTVLYITNTDPEEEYTESSGESDDDHGVPWCRLLALVVILILLTKQLVGLLSDKAEGYAFTLSTVFLLRAIGILMPFCLIMSLITAIQNAQTVHLYEGEVSEDDMEQQ